MTKRLLVLAGAAVLAAPTAARAQPADGLPDWATRPPAAWGFDAGALERAFRLAGRLDPVRSLLVARRGTLVAEKYWGDAGPHRPTNIKSASKAVLSALVGVALERGDLRSLDWPVAEFFPEYFERDGVDPRKRGITLRHLLTMTSGLETTSFHNYGRWVASDDWVRAALDQPLVARPGGRMVYSTGSSHLLSAILARATGMDTRTFARRHLFRPLGIRLDGWQRGPEGVWFGGNNMALSPRDLLRFGTLYLHGGTYGGRRVLPDGWVRESWRAYTRSERFGYDFGYYWWNRTLSGRRVHYAWGYGGQFVFVVPEEEMVVVVTSASRPEGRGGVGHLRDVYRLLERHLIPAAR